MIDVCITIDAESRKDFRCEEPIHLDFEHDVWQPCLALDDLAVRYGAAFTFFYPLSELVASDPRAEPLAERLAARHELGVHLHRPFAAWSAERIAQTLGAERDRFERLTGRPASTVRAGGYNTGKHQRWIQGLVGAGLTVDSSVWPGASTEVSAECRAAASELARHWGSEGISYDHRGAPVAGLYRAARDSLGQPGDGPVIEAPIAAAFYDEREPGVFRLDPQRTTFDLLRRTLEQIAQMSTGRALAVVILHSGGISRGDRLTGAGRRLAALLEWVGEVGAELRTLGSARELDLALYGPVYAPNQHQAWTTVDRSALIELLRRCPRCGGTLDDLSCPACGWSARTLGPTLVDARAARPEIMPGPASPPSVAARRFRALLALTGGALGIAVGLALYPLAAAWRGVRRRGRVMGDGGERRTPPVDSG